MKQGPQRIDQLAARVSWLDRYRRTLGICLGVIVGPLLFAQLSADWPRAHAIPLMIATGMVTWWLAEAALAYVTALWETECDQLTRDRGLPRAIVRK